MVEKTLIVIITLIFSISSWWWSNRQNDAETFYEVQLYERDAVITQLSRLALQQVQGKTPEEVQTLFQSLYPQNDALLENGILFSGPLGVRFAKGGVVSGFYLPWEEIEKASPQ